MANLSELFARIGSGRKQALPVTHLVVGLGNPEPRYENTRHNAGFLALDRLAERAGARVDRARFRALCGEAEIAGHRVLLVKPQTYMNLSGDAVREAASYYRIPPAHVIVLSDDINLDPGRLRVRGQGSDGGHNGLKHIIAQLGTDAFPRVRIGVGKKPAETADLADWVLSSFRPEERRAIEGSFETLFAGVELLLAGDLAGAMQRCNGR